MKRIKKIYLMTALSLSLFSIMFCVLLLNFTKTSYAIETGTFSNGYPTETFSTNKNRDALGDTINLVQDALGSDTSYASIMKSFVVTKNFADNNNTNPLYVLMKNSEVPTGTESFELTNEAIMNVGPGKTINDRGLTYIINHGYNNTNSVNTVFDDFPEANDNLDNETKHYITQIALWLYIYENKDKFKSTICTDIKNHYSTCDFLDNNNLVVEATTIKTILNKAGSSSDGKFVKYILKLVEDAKKYTGSGESAIGSFKDDIKYSFTNDGSMIYIYNLVPNITGNRDNYMYYAVEVDDPNSYGVYIADKNDNKITNTSQMNESFSVVIPIGDDISKLDLSTVTIKVYAYFVLDENKLYAVTKSTAPLLPNTTVSTVIKIDDTKYNRFSDVLLGYTPYQIISTQFKLDNFTKISKVDVTNSNELPGATLVVTNKDDSTKKWTWVSTNKPHQIELENGDYSLCETIAPDGYELNTECVDFTVDGKSITTVKMENKPVHIPNTGKMFNRLVIFIGLALVLAGGGIISYLTFYKKKILIKKEV